MANMILKTAAGRFGALAGTLMIAAALWVSFGGSIGAAPPPADPQTCLPSCSEVDGRMLVVAGDDDSTLAAQAIGIGLTFTQANAPNVNFEFFDGDANLDRWDSPYTGTTGAASEKVAPDLIIELYRDVAGTGGTVKLATWGDPSSGVDQGTLAFTDNGWFGTTFAHDPQSLVPGSNPAIYRYAMRILPSGPATHRGWNVFKVRAFGKVLLNGQQVFGFIAAMNLNFSTNPQHQDVKTIYPNIVIPSNPLDLSGTTYNGVWTFQTTLSPFLTNVTVYDGDMDYGNQDCTFNDLDDPDSSGVPGFLLPGNNAVAEGVAVAESTQNSIKYCGGNPANPARTGLPADDNGDAINGPGIYERKPVSTVPNNVAYKLVAPDGQIFINGNPSGNREWEQFRIQLVNTGEFDPADLCPAPNPSQANPLKNPAGGYLASGPYPASDCRTDVLPGGDWTITLEGMDLNNLNFWFFDFTIEPPDPHYSIGRLVWFDGNSNAIQDFCGATPCSTELGIPGVTVSAYDGDPEGPGGDGAAAPFIAQLTTDANGEFLFQDGTLGVGINWPAHDYKVVVDASNFDPGGPLEGLTSTTGGEIETNVEVGLPVCTDTGVPANCGEPSYAEAIFGYNQDVCVITPVNGGPPFIGAVHTYVQSPQGTPNGYLTLRTTLNKDFVDNTYGTNAHTGWPKGHTFSNLTGSDKMTLQLYDANGVKKLEFAMDYISASAAAGQQGYDTLGVAGGDGKMIFGSAANIFDIDTSLAVNFRDLTMPPLTVNSPTTNPLNSYQNPVAPYQPWIFDVWYDVTFNTAVFEPAGYGYARMSGIHASPSKTGSNTEICVYEADLEKPPVALADFYDARTAKEKSVGAPGVLKNDTPGAGGAMTAILVTGPSNGTLTGPLLANGSFKYKSNPGFVGNDTFTYKANNANGDSNIATVTMKVTK